MEWYPFGLDRMLMFLFSFSVALIIILTVMFHQSVIERGPRKYVDMG